MVIALGLSSCATEEESFLIEDQVAKSLLNSYELKRNADGSYYVDYGTTGATSELIVDEKRQENNIMLYPSNSNAVSRGSQALGYVTANNQLMINFNDTQKNKITSLKVIDDDMRLSKDENELLDTFTFKNNGDGTYDLDYKVKENVITRVEYNEQLGVYDVILEEGNANQSEFLHTFTPDNEDFEIHFVTRATSARDEERRKPILDPNGNQGGSGTGD